MQNPLIPSGFTDGQALFASSVASLILPIGLLVASGSLSTFHTMEQQSAVPKPKAQGEHEWSSKYFFQPMENS